ncbi:hypothetical protein FQN50_001353 [Emmonsiellopsis sp. PD_5]|nr:hypothetical protein FQN50_001353 [Emmonsiellopsis sp. PD_5]
MSVLTTTKLLTYQFVNLSTHKTVAQMDGFWGLDLEDKPYFTGNLVPAEDMHQGNSVPFYRKQDDLQVQETHCCAEQVPVALPRKHFGGGVTRRL